MPELTFVSDQTAERAARIATLLREARERRGPIVKELVDTLRGAKTIAIVVAPRSRPRHDRLGHRARTRAR